MLYGCHENPPSPANDELCRSLLLPLHRSQLPPPSLALHPRLAEDRLLVSICAKNNFFPDFIHWDLKRGFSGERSFPTSTLRTNPCSWSSLQREQALHPITGRDVSGNSASQISTWHLSPSLSAAPCQLLIRVACSLHGN